MAGAAWPTRTGIRIAPVYTPPAHRGRGYGSAVTAAATRAQLDAGRSACYLYTDLANLTSNQLYRALGYEPVTDVDRLRFGPPPGDRARRQAIRPPGCPALLERLRGWLGGVDRVVVADGAEAGRRLVPARRSANRR